MKKVILGLIVLLSSSLANSTVIFSEDFSDNSAGWTLGPEWEIGPAMVSSGSNGLTADFPDPALDHTPTDDNGVAGVNIGGNAGTSQHGFYWLTSPIINTGDILSSLSLTYYRWLSSDYTPFMQNRIDVFDGLAWNTIWQTGPFPPVTDDSWVEQSFSITEYANANMQIRWGFNIASPGVWTVPGWSVDDVSVTSDSASVNEPPIVALLLLGLAGMVTRGRAKH